MKNKVCGCLAAIIMITVVSMPVYSAAQISIKVNEEYIVSDAAPVIYNDRVLVPARAVMEAIGAEVEWNEDAGQVLVMRNGTFVTIKVGDNHVFRNNSCIETDVSASIINDRTFIPVRAITEAFDCGVEWDGDTKTVTVKDGYAPFYSSSVPVWTGEAYADVGDGKADFTENDKNTVVFENYSKRDNLGRCRTAYANLCEELKPDEKRSDISSVTPTGWNNSFYNCVPGGWLYNRCHLIGYQLAGENDNADNLITGTRYLNNNGMLPFENKIAKYIKESGNHVLYRVTPVFTGAYLLADGVRLEAYSVEDGGVGIDFDVFCYNVQPDISLNYETGENGVHYILNTVAQKYHKLDCELIRVIYINDKKDYYGKEDWLEKNNFQPCKRCFDEK